MAALLAAPGDLHAAAATPPDPTPPTPDDRRGRRSTRWSCRSWPARLPPSGPPRGRRSIRGGLVGAVGAVAVWGLREILTLITPGPLSATDPTGRGPRTPTSPVGEDPADPAGTRQRGPGRGGQGPRRQLRNPHPLRRHHPHHRTPSTDPDPGAGAPGCGRRGGRSAAAPTVSPRSSRPSPTTTSTGAAACVAPTTPSPPVGSAGGICSRSPNSPRSPPCPPPAHPRPGPGRRPLGRPTPGHPHPRTRRQTPR